MGVWRQEAQSSSSTCSDSAEGDRGLLLRFLLGVECLSSVRGLQLSFPCT